MADLEARVMAALRQKGHSALPAVERSRWKPFSSGERQMWRLRVGRKTEGRHFVVFAFFDSHPEDGVRIVDTSDVSITEDSFHLVGWEKPFYGILEKLPSKKGFQAVRAVIEAYFLFKQDDYEHPNLEKAGVWADFERGLDLIFPQEEAVRQFSLTLIDILLTIAQSRPEPAPAATTAAEPSSPASEDGSSLFMSEGDTSESEAEEVNSFGMAEESERGNTRQIPSMSSTASRKYGMFGGAPTVAPRRRKTYLTSPTGQPSKRDRSPPATPEGRQKRQHTSDIPASPAVASGSAAAPSAGGSGITPTNAQQPNDAEYPREIFRGMAIGQQQMLRSLLHEQDTKKAAEERLRNNNTEHAKIAGEVQELSDTLTAQQDDLSDAVKAINSKWLAEDRRLQKQIDEIKATRASLKEQAEKDKADARQEHEPEIQSIQDRIDALQKDSEALQDKIDTDQAAVDAAKVNAWNLCQQGRTELMENLRTAMERKGELDAGNAT